MRFLNVFYCIICLVTLSCSNNENQELKDLQIRLNSLEDIFNKIELSSYNDACDGFSENLKLIKNCNDSVSKQFVSLINQYKVIKKTKDIFILEYKMLSKNFQLEKAQLKALKKDLENKLIPKDSIKFYLNKEEKNIMVISDEINNVSTIYNEIISVHESLYSKIKELANNNCS
ncbi:MAG: hypothetical protein CL846_03520 [Crocinitomicaceae bacterium]|nr:hypothetical protein [Crocinitomicaceae bacterium]|tara:strand:+ start:7786 stop:8307 length:522 start_codon:yes stop_codon:yes gene_type:complete